MISAWNLFWMVPGLITFGYFIAVLAFTAKRADEQLSYLEPQPYKKSYLRRIK